MRLIAHRGNLYGPSPHENIPAYLEAALRKGYDIEVDVWFLENGYWLGHDEPKYHVDKMFLIPDFEDHAQIWCHAKNKAAFEKMLNDGMHCFWHEDDKYTLTSRRVVWSFPDTEYVPNSVMNQPEWSGVEKLYELNRKQMDKYVGICSDYVALLQDIYNNTLYAQRDY